MSSTSNTGTIKTRSGRRVAETRRTKRPKLELDMSEQNVENVAVKNSIGACSVDPGPSEDEDDGDSSLSSPELEEYDEYEEDINIDAVAGGEVEAPKAKTDQNALDNDYPFTVLTMADITKHMDDLIHQANSVLQLPPAIMRILLNHFKWDKDKLVETFYDHDQEELFKSAHILIPNEAIKPGAVSRRKKEECFICYDLCSSSDMLGLPCGHRFCHTCWSTHLTMKIMTEGVAQSLECPQQGCDIAVDEVTVKMIVAEAKVLEKYQYLLASNFVECNRLVRWCPAPAGCTNAIRAQWIASRPVTCSCGFTFCFQCGHDWHDPTTCDLLKKWLKKCADDSETSRWLQTYTKDCPKCHVQIEKDGGCNHMTCRNSTCKFEFCWVCLGKWPHVATTACNRFDPSKQKVIEESRTALQRYLFYCDRYMNHLRSLKFEHKLYASVKEKMAVLQENHMSWKESQYLKEAVDMLCQCRQTLMYTYSFAFYLQKTNQCVIFEDNQGDLEQATEDLSEILEKEDDSIEFLLSTKQKVHDKAGYCKSRRKVLIDHVHEGNEKDWWTFFDP